jgi:YegS/Rv2252/BmrU family lipid kinase
MQQMRRVWFFANQKARSGKDLFHQGLDELELAAQVERAELVPPGDLPNRIKEAIEAKPDVVAIGGGDGTQSMAAGLLQGTDIALGVMPFGTGNAFARDLGLPRSPQQAARIAATGEIMSVDVGKIGEKIFTNLVSLGLAVAISRSLDKRLKKQVGQFAYLSALASAMPVTRPFRLKLLSDDQTIETEAVQVALGPGRFHGGPFPLRSDASLRSGKLAGYVLESFTLGDMAKTAFGSFSSAAKHWQQSHHLEASKVEILEPEGKVINVDGERSMRTPATVEILPRALKVCIPDDFKRRMAELRLNT